LNQVKWTKPVRPNDVLCVVATVLEVRRSGNKPLGILRPGYDFIGLGLEFAPRLMLKRGIHAACPHRFGSAGSFVSGGRGRPVAQR
jgi:hypothetical protein